VQNSERFSVATFRRRLAEHLERAHLARAPRDDG
jgi:hypothetical protein